MRTIVLDIHGMPSGVQRRAVRQLVGFRTAWERGVGRLHVPVHCVHRPLATLLTRLDHVNLVDDVIGGDHGACLNATRAVNDGVQWVCLRSVERANEAWPALVYLSEGLVRDVLRMAETKAWTVVLTSSSVAGPPYTSFVCVVPPRGVRPVPLRAYGNVADVLCATLATHAPCAHVAPCAVTTCLDVSDAAGSQHASEHRTMWVRIVTPRTDRANDVATTFRFSLHDLLCFDADASECERFAVASRCKRCAVVDVARCDVDVGDVGGDDRRTLAAGASLPAYVDARLVHEALRVEALDLRVAADGWCTPPHVPLCAREQLPVPPLPSVCTCLVPATERVGPRTMPVLGGVLCEATRTVDLVAPHATSVAVHPDGESLVVAGWSVDLRSARCCRMDGSTVYVAVATRIETTVHRSRAARPVATERRMR